MQVQLASVSFAVMGCFAVLQDHEKIIEGGLFQNMSLPAVLTIVNSGLGGLTVAAVLKYADAILKGYSSALSVVLTGVLSTFLFGTSLSALYVLGITNVVVSIVLYGSKTLDKNVCG